MGALAELLWEAFTQRRGGRSKVTGGRCSAYMNIVGVRKPWRTAHIGACDIQLIKVHGFGIACAYRRLYLQ
jgi:hypothetical protein